MVQGSWSRRAPPFCNAEQPQKSACSQPLDVKEVSGVWDLNQVMLTNSAMMRCLHKTIAMQRSSFFLAKLTVAQLVRNYPHFMKPEGSLPCSQEAATFPYCELDEFSPQHHTLF
jgi:hypothetical protein